MAYYNLGSKFSLGGTKDPHVISFTILAFIGASLKFIRTIAIELVMGLLGILCLFYGNSRSARNGEESKQPINPRSSPNIRDTILTLTPTTLRTDGP